MERQEATEARPDEGQPAIPPIEYMAQGSQGLTLGDCRRQFGERPVALTMAETIESQGGNAVLH